MKITAVATLFTLILGAVAMPENIAERDAGVEASTFNLWHPLVLLRLGLGIDSHFGSSGAGCPNGPSLNACNELCAGVVRRACAACTTGACKTACQHGARMSKCLGCCTSRCVTC